MENMSIATGMLAIGMGILAIAAGLLALVLVVGFAKYTYDIMFRRR